MKCVHHFEKNQKFNSLNNSQNVTVNATAYETNKQLQLSLAASSNFNSTFTGYFNNTKGTKYAVNITSIYLKGYINQTVEGTPVNFEVSVYYSNLIAKSDRYIYRHRAVLCTCTETINKEFYRFSICYMGYYFPKRDVY